MRTLFLSLLLLLQVACVTAQTPFNATPWKLNIFTNITDLAAHGSPFNVNKVSAVANSSGLQVFFATNTVSGSNTTTRVASALVAGYAWDLIATSDTSTPATGGTAINATDGRYPVRQSATNFAEGSLSQANLGQDITITTTNNANTSLNLKSLNTNNSTAFISGKATDSDGTVSTVELNMFKSTGWGFGTPAARNGELSINVLHAGSLNQRLSIDGSAGILFYDRDGNIVLAIAGTNVSASGNLTGMGQVIIGTNYTAYGNMVRSGFGFLVNSDKSVDGVGITRLVLNSQDSTSGNSGSYIDFRTANSASATNIIIQLFGYRSAGVNSFGWDWNADAWTPDNNYFRVVSNTVPLWTMDGYGQQIFGPGTTNVIFRSGSDLVYTNGDTQPNFKVKNGSGVTASIGINAGGSAVVGSSSGFLYVSGTLIAPSGVNIGTGSTITKVISGIGTLDFPSTATQTSSDLTITVTGAAVGDVVSLGVPNGSVLSDSSFSAWVSSANTVTVRFNNYSAGAKDPASGSFRAQVTQF